MAKLAGGNSRSTLLALTPAWAAMAWLISKAQWYWSNRPDLQFGWVVLLLVAFLLWDIWEKQPEPRYKTTIPSIGLLLVGVALLFVVQIYQAAMGFMPAAMMGLTGAVLSIVGANLLYVFGWPGLRHFAFPFLFFLIALPLPSAIYNPIVTNLQSAVASVNVEILNLAGVPARKVGSLIHLPSGVVGVDEACSGIRSLQSTLMATLFIGYLTLKRPTFQLALLIGGILLALVGNVIRSLVLSFAATHQGVDAVDKFHDSAGWSILLFTATGVAALSWIFSKLEKRLTAFELRIEQEQTASAEPAEA